MRADEAWVVVVVLGGVESIDVAPACGGGEPTPLGLAIAFAGAIDDQAVLLNLGLVEVRAEAIVAVLVHRERGNHLAKAAAIFQVPGQAVHVVQRHTGGFERSPDW